MLGLVIRRISTLVPVLLIVLLITFALVSLTPGDPARLVAGDTATPQQLAQTRSQLGLDQSFVKQFFTYVGNVFRLNLGTSLQTGQPVLHQIAETLPVTLSLLLLSLLISAIIGILAGTLAAWHRGGIADRVISTLCAFGNAIPPFVVALALLIPLAVNHTWFPAVGYSPVADGLGPWLQHLVLPAFALSLPAASQVARQTQAAMIDALEQDYIRTTRAAGLSSLSVVGKHAMKNSGMQIVTSLGLQVGFIIGGSILVEQIFAFPGFGSLAYNAVVNHDYPVIRGVVLCSGLIILIANLLVDVSYGYFSPSLRH